MFLKFENNRNMKKILLIFMFLIVFMGLSGQVKFTDNRDGNVYRTIAVAGATWMAENLKYKAQSGAFYFDNDSNNIPDYGVLYEWKIAADPSSFGIQLGGMQDYEGTFSEMDESCYYLTSTEYDRSNAEYFSYLIIDDKPIIDISRKEDMVDIHGTEKTNKYSVRCLKD
jgi:hypothetical protein